MRMKKLTAAFMALCMGMSVLPLQASGSDTPPQELLHLSFEDSLSDSGPYANEAVAYGTMEYVEGVRGKALHITNENGSSAAKGENYIQLPEAVKLGSEDFSISLWYKSDSGTEDGGTIIANKDYTSGGNSPALRPHLPDRRRMASYRREL